MRTISRKLTVYADQKNETHNEDDSSELLSKCPTTESIQQNLPKGLSTLVTRKLERGKIYKMPENREIKLPVHVLSNKNQHNQSYKTKDIQKQRHVWKISPLTMNLPNDAVTHDL